MWPNFLNQCGYTNAEALIPQSVYSQRPARELHQLDKSSVNSQLSHASARLEANAE